MALLHRTCPVALRHACLGLAISSLVHAGGLALLAVPAKPPVAEGPRLTIAAALGTADREGETGEVAARVVRDASQLTGDLVQARIESLIAGQSGLPPARQMQRLDRMARQLETVSSEQSLEELAVTLQGWLGLGRRAVEPAAGAAQDGQFDFDTAQLHDVLRRPMPPGTWQYVAVLLDARGRTMEVEMDAADGERTYCLMQRLKAHPLLGRVYRQLAMPLLDRLSRSARHSASPTR